MPYFTISGLSAYSHGSTDTKPPSSGSNPYKDMHAIGNTCTFGLTRSQVLWRRMLHKDVPLFVEHLLFDVRSHISCFFLGFDIYISNVWLTWNTRHVLALADSDIWWNSIQSTCGQIRHTLWISIWQSKALFFRYNYSNWYLSSIPLAPHRCNPTFLNSAI